MPSKGDPSQPHGVASPSADSLTCKGLGVLHSPLPAGLSSKALGASSLPAGIARKWLRWLPLSASGAELCSAEVSQAELGCAVVSSAVVPVADASCLACCAEDAGLLDSSAGSVRMPHGIIISIHNPTGCAVCNQLHSCMCPCCCLW